LIKQQTLKFVKFKWLNLFLFHFIFS
jgi:hypothetical protein